MAAGALLATAPIASAEPTVDVTGEHGHSDNYFNPTNAEYFDISGNSGHTYTDIAFAFPPQLEDVNVDIDHNSGVTTTVVDNTGGPGDEQLGTVNIYDNTGPTVTTVTDNPRIDPFISTWGNTAPVTLNLSGGSWDEVYLGDTGSSTTVNLDGPIAGATAIYAGYTGYAAEGATEAVTINDNVGDVIGVPNYYADPVTVNYDGTTYTVPSGYGADFEDGAEMHLHLLP